MWGGVEGNDCNGKEKSLTYSLHTHLPKEAGVVFRGYFSLLFFLLLLFQSAGILSGKHRFTHPSSSSQARIHLKALSLSSPVNKERESCSPLERLFLCHLEKKYYFLIVLRKTLHFKVFFVFFSGPVQLQRSLQSLRETRWGLQQDFLVWFITSTAHGWPSNDPCSPYSHD